jgi:hypothetical protein
MRFPAHQIVEGDAPLVLLVAVPVDMIHLDGARIGKSTTPAYATDHVERPLASGSVLNLLGVGIAV